MNMSMISVSATLIASIVFAIHAIPGELSEDTAGTSYLQIPDSTTIRMLQLYSDWVSPALRASVLFDTAVSRGISIHPEELRERQSYYHEAFPGIAMDPIAVKEEIVVEKYLIKEIGISPSSAASQENGDFYFKNTPLQEMSQKDIVSALAESRALFSNDEVRIMCEMEGQAWLIKSSTGHPMWEIRDLAIEGNAQGCLASDPECNECIATTDDYNCFLRLHPISRSIGLDEAKEITLNKLLREHYYSLKTEEMTIPGKNELVESHMNAIEKRLIRSQVKAFGSDTAGDSLRMIYEKYYDRFFKEKTTVVVGLIGSTDSLYLDSLRNKLQRNQYGTSAESLSKLRQRIETLDWVIVRADSLPDGVLSVVDTLKLQRLTIVKNSFGFYLCRVIRREHRQSIPFEDAYDKLVYLRCREKEFLNGQADSAKYLRYYIDHCNEFIAPDTFTCRIWLIPDADSSFYEHLDLPQRKSYVSNDTNHFKSQLITSTLLPKKIAEIFHTRSVKNICEGDINGPIFDEYGKWYFINYHTAAGKTIQSFSDVRREIYRKFEVQQLPFDSIKNTEVGEIRMKMAALAYVYRTYADSEINIFEDEDAKRPIKNGTLKVSDRDNDSVDSDIDIIARHTLQLKKIEKRIVAADTWIQALSIDRNLLLGGLAATLEK